MRALTVILTGLSALLAAALVVAWLPGGRPAPAPSSRPAPSGQPSDAALKTSDHSESWAKTILARPLFSHDRRPMATQGKVATGPTTELPRLTAVVVSPGGRQAIFAPPGGAKQLIVAEGGTVGAYIVSAIGDGWVTITGPDGPRRLKPSFATGEQATGSPAVSASAVDADRLRLLGPTPSGLDLLRNPPNIPIPAAPKK